MSNIPNPIPHICIYCNNRHSYCGYPPTMEYCEHFVQGFCLTCRAKETTKQCIQNLHIFDCDAHRCRIYNKYIKSIKNK